MLSDGQRTPTTVQGVDLGSVGIFQGTPGTNLIGTARLLKAALDYWNGLEGARRSRFRKDLSV